LETNEKWNREPGTGNEGNEGTHVNFGAILRVDVEKIPQLKSLIESFGGRILYQRVVPRWVRLMVCADERKPEEAGR
jgi:hypothetical protein